MRARVRSILPPIALHRRLVKSLSPKLLAHLWFIIIIIIIATTTITILIMIAYIEKIPLLV